MSSISWGRRDRYKFAACGGLSAWVPPMLSAVYAITYKKDPLNKPKSHTVLYFGECEDLSHGASAINKWVVDFWADSGGISDDLYVFIHAMSGSTSYERSRLQQRLIAEYQPHGNDL